MNDLQLYATDISNAYLKSYTSEKVYIIAGPEFSNLEGHTLLVVKALYGLHKSGICWHEHFTAILREMGFKPALIDPDIWT